MANEQFRVVLNDDLLPAQAFFNAIGDKNFIHTLEAFQQGRGIGYNYAFCSFLAESHSKEEAPEGVKFFLMDEAIVLSYVDFFELLKYVCKKFVDVHPEEKGYISDLLTELGDKLRYLSGTSH